MGNGRGISLLDFTQFTVSGDSRMVKRVVMLFVITIVAIFSALEIHKRLASQQIDSAAI